MRLCNNAGAADLKELDFAWFEFIELWLDLECSYIVLYKS